MKKIILWGCGLAILISGCSGAQKTRRDERERLVQSKGVYCDFVSESDYTDVDIELNLRIAKKCDPSKPFNITSHKRVSDNPGVLYCCNVSGNFISELESSSKPESAAEMKSTQSPGSSSKVPTTK